MSKNQFVENLPTRIVGNWTVKSFYTFSNSGKTKYFKQNIEPTNGFPNMEIDLFYSETLKNFLSIEKELKAELERLQKKSFEDTNWNFKTADSLLTDLQEEVLRLSQMETDISVILANETAETIQKMVDYKHLALENGQYFISSNQAKEALGFLRKFDPNLLINIIDSPLYNEKSWVELIERCKKEVLQELIEKSIKRDFLHAYTKESELPERYCRVIINLFGDGKIHVIEGKAGDIEYEGYGAEWEYQEYNSLEECKMVIQDTDIDCYFNVELEDQKTWISELIQMQLDEHKFLVYQDKMFVANHQSLTYCCGKSIVQYFTNFWEEDGKINIEDTYEEGGHWDIGKTSDNYCFVSLFKIQNL